MTGEIIPVITVALKICESDSRSLVKIPRKVSFPKCNITLMILRAVDYAPYVSDKVATLLRP